MEEHTFSGYLGPQFQMKLLWQIITEPEFAEKITPLLNVSYFDDTPTKLFFISIQNYFDDFGRVPNLQNNSIYQAIKKYSNDSTNEELLNSVAEKIVLWNEKILNDTRLFDGDIIQKETYTYIRQQEYRKLAEYIFSEVKQGSTKKSDEILVNVDNKIKIISEIGDDEDMGSEIFEDIDSALQKEFRKPIPTGISGIDKITGGGLGRGEIGILLAASGVGKTTYLTQVANKCQEVEKNVLQIVFEDTVDQIKRKHYAIISGVKLSEMDNNSKLVKQKVLEYEEKNNLGRLVIKRFPQENTTIPKIRQWIDNYQKKFGFKFNMIVLDYIDCLDPHNKSVDITSGEIGIIKAFESMSAEYDIPCWTAIQTNRSGFNAELVDASQMGGSIKRAQKTHFLMSVAKNQEQKSEGRANISILKARFAQDGQVFKDAIFDNDTMEIKVTDDDTYTKKIRTKNISQEQSENFKKIGKTDEDEVASDVVVEIPPEAKFPDTGESTVAKFESEGVSYSDDPDEIAKKLVESSGFDFNKVTSMLDGTAKTQDIGKN